MTDSDPALPPARLGIRSLRDFYVVVFRHLGKSALAFLVVLAVTAAASLLWTPRYQSEARLLVRIAAAADPLTVTGRVVGVPRTRESEIRSELAILDSADLLRTVVEKLGPETISRLPAEESAGALAPAEIALVQLQEDLRAGVEPESNIIQLVFRHESPLTAARVLEELIAVYLEKRIELHRSAGTYEFLTEQLRVLDTRIRGQRERLYEIHAAEAIYALDEQRRAIGALVIAREDAIAELTAAIAASVSKVEKLQAEFEQLEDTHVLQETAGDGNPVADHMRTKLFDLSLVERELLAKFPPDSRPVEDVRSRIEMIRAQLGGEDPERRTVTTGPDANRPQLRLAIVNEQAALLGMRARLEAEQQAVATARERLAALGAQEREIAELEREIALGEATRARYLESVEQARIDRAREDQKISNISVVQAATRSPLPAGPGRGWILVIGVVIAAFVALGTTFLADYLDDSFHTPEDVEGRLHLPVLASVPLRRRLGRALGRARAARHPWDGTLPRDIARECRLLVERASVKLKTNRRPIVLGVTGSRNGVGVTSIAAFLAADLARRAHGAVALVDRDEDEQRLTRELSDPAAEGADDPRAPRATPFDRLHLIAADAGDDAFHDIIEQGSYSFVVVDIPSVDRAEHALSDARACDGVLIVIAAGVNRWQGVRRTVDVLTDGGARVVGAVLNQRRYPVPGWLYRTL